MKQYRFKKIFSFIFLIFIISVSAQNEDKLWLQKMPSEIDASLKMDRRSTPIDYKVFNLDLNLLKNELQIAPKRTGKSSKSSNIISFPNGQGELEKYEVFEASILDESLQEKFPNIKSYVGRSIENKNNIIHFSISKLGLHAMILQSTNGSIYIDPYTSNKESYIIYSKKNVPVSEQFECTVEELGAIANQTSTNVAEKNNNADDGLLRTFRLAVATTGEYSQFQLIYNGISRQSSELEKKEVVLSAINATMTRVNGIFERDLSLTMTLVANNTEIIYLDPVTDPFTNDTGSILIEESQITIDQVIGFNNYDIGHTFSTGGGGLATLKSPCTTSKAKGITGSSYPIGDFYDVDFVAHEMGHQYGANHTFNGDKGSCNGNRNQATAVEPGSGSTIMSYAGLCAPENVQAQSDAYFHLISIQEMWANISSGNSTCAQTSATNNSAPIVTPLLTYTIPKSTPFVLNAEATDSSGDILTYTWEQLNNNIAVAPPVSTATQGPSFRSVGPSISSMRYFPNINTVLSGLTSNTWEVLPSVGRTMKFGVNVRDNNINGGQSASEETTITFDENSGPFVVTSQNEFETWNSGETKTISWDVANTNIAPVNCATVNILLSLDGGYTFPILLASNIANNGSTTITVPNETTTSGRIKVESVNNIFYDITNTNISIQAKEFTINFETTNAKVCKPANAIFNFTYKTYLGFNEVTTFSAIGNPPGTTVTFSPTTATSNDTSVQMTVSGIDNVEVGHYNFIVEGISNETSMVKKHDVSLDLYSNTLVAPTPSFPLNNELEVLKEYELVWSSDINSTSYIVEISTDSSFETIIEESLVNETFYLPKLLTVNKRYYWRVKAKNDCGESPYSAIFNFTTANEVCNNYNSTDVPKSIPDNDISGAISVINITDNKYITDVNVTVNITHPYVSDLSLSLISPNGIEILLSVDNGGSGSNYTNTVFDDAASISIEKGSAPFVGSFIPQIPLSYLNNVTSGGSWKLIVIDSGDQDIGTINNWSLQICGIPFVGNDDDFDGVNNEIDQCPNTPLGTEVNEVGCFALTSNNFNIQLTGESCVDKENGQIIITAKEDYNYTTTSINGTSYSFTNKIPLIIENLPAGTYDFCILVEGQNFEQCYSLVIEPGTLLEAKVTVKSAVITVNISKGTAPFKTFVNSNPIFETLESSFSLDVNQGDLVEVKSANECEGVFAKQIDLFEIISLYPNPTKGNFKISIPYAKNEVLVEIYNMQSQLISSKQYPIKNGSIQLNIQDKPIGLYIVKLYLDKPMNFKVIKN